MADWPAGRAARACQTALVRPIIVRVLLVALAVPNLVAGLWAVLAPEHWYENFPGWPPALVAAHPPYNDHLASDAGAGLLASGLLAALAVVWTRRDVVTVAMIGYLGFSVPHGLFHLTHPSDLLSTAEDTANAVAVVVAVVAAVAVLVLSLRKSSV